MTGDQSPATAPTLGELGRRRAAATPDRPYVHLYGDVLTYDGLWRLSGRYAAGLARAGIVAGDRVCLIYPTCTDFFATFFGALRLGAVPVPLYPTLGVEGTAAILRNAEAAAVATIGWFRRSVEESARLAPSVRTILEPPDLDVDAALPPVPEPAPEDLAFLQYTSGSTGQPRGVMLTHANIIGTVRFMAAAAGLTEDDRLASWLPLYHDMGLIGGSLTPLLTGTPVWLLPPDLRNPRQWLELITTVRATVTVSPDFGYRNCVRHVGDAAAFDLSSLRLALSGAEPVRLSTIEAFEDRFGLKHVVAPCYGLAEATLAVAMWPWGTPVRHDVSGRFTSVGPPCPGVSVCIRPLPEAATAGTGDLGPGLEGEICVKSPGVMRGYYNDHAATARVLSSDGWLRTGDLGFLDADGLLYVTGRIKDLIVLGGANVVPADIEEIVDQVPGVRYSAAVGLESNRTGTQRLHVVAELREEPAEAVLRRITVDIVKRIHEERRHRPARVLLVRAGTIPKTSSGKIQRSRLAAMLASDAIREHLVYPRSEA